MWKIVFEFCDFVFSLVPVAKWQHWLRRKKLFDYRRKLDALKKAYPNLNFKTLKLVKGGGSLAFVLENKYVFKVRKHKREQINFARFSIEKRITDALRDFCPVAIPKIELMDLSGYTFYKTEYIPGKLLVNIPFYKICKYKTYLAKQLANIILDISKADPIELQDMRKEKRNGFCWVHGDMCSNILVNPKNMRITGIIDWEWASYREQEYEFKGLVWVRKKMKKTGLDEITKQEYNKLVK